MPICPKVVLVTMFEPADRAGELSLFRERLDLEQVQLAETGLDDIYLGSEGDILAITTGVGTANTAIAIASLGLCPEVDTSKSFWVISGIAGADPQVATLGSPVWADWCVDGDFALEIDAREIPAAWSTGILPLGAQEPFGKSRMTDDDLGRAYQVFEFNHALVEAAYELTKDIPLLAHEKHHDFLNKFGPDTTATQPPAVLRGDCISAARYFHGARATQWARQWVAHWTEDKGRFATCGMEDSGTLHAIKHLTRLGRANDQRALLLRTASNFTQPPPNESPTAHFNDENTFPAFDLALENGTRTAMTVIDAILADWEDWDANY